MPNLINGLGGPAGFGAGVLGPNDDLSTGSIDLTPIFGPSGLDFFGQNYTSVFVNNNGNLTFANPTSQYSPSPIGTGLPFPIIAAFWTDVDTRAGSQSPSPGGTSTGTDLVYYDVNTTTNTFTATWDDVDYYNTQRGHPNAFQIQLISTGNGNFDIVFNYEYIQPDSGGFYISSARAGYSPGLNGQGQPLPGSYEIPDSAGNMANVGTDPGNTGVPGYYLFHVVGGQVNNNGGGSSSPPPAPVNSVTFAVGVETHDEGDSGATPFLATITRMGNGAASNLADTSTVDWQIQVDDPAHNLVAGQPLSGTVTFAPGQTTATVEIDVQGDRIFEQSQFLQLHLSHGTYGDQSFDLNDTGTGIILNDDPRTSFTFAGPVIRPEGQFGASPFDFMVLRGGDVTQASTVHWALATGTADLTDLSANQPLTGTVTFAAGETQAIIEVDVAGDRVVEPDEAFTLQLTSASTDVPGGAPTVTTLHETTTGTILDDDSRRTLLVGSPTILTHAEGNGDLTTFDFTVMRVGDTTAAADMAYTITAPSDGASGLGEVTSPLTGSVHFAAGAGRAVLTVQTHGDTIPNPDESFLVHLGGGAFNTLTLTGVIMNDDKVAVAAGPSAGAAADAGAADVSSFMHQLMGGGLWPAELV